MKEISGMNENIRLDKIRFIWEELRTFPINFQSKPTARSQSNNTVLETM
jgi:hypothetical protein